MYVFFQFFNLLWFTFLSYSIMKATFNFIGNKSIAKCCFQTSPNIDCVSVRNHVEMCDLIYDQMNLKLESQLEETKSLISKLNPFHELNKASKLRKKLIKLYKEIEPFREQMEAKIKEFKCQNTLMSNLTYKEKFVSKKAVSKLRGGLLFNDNN